jgi:hypothetical protein
MPDTEQELFESALNENPVPVVRLEEPEAKPEQAEAETQQQTEARERDEKGRFSKADKAEEKPEPVAKQEAPQAEPKPETVEEKPERGEIPAWRLREEAEAKRDAIARAETHERENAALRQQLAQFQKQQAEAKNPPPDMYMDPDGWQRHQTQTFESTIRAERAATNEELARIKFGDELFDKAEKEAQQHFAVNPQDPSLQVIVNSRRPAFELIKWFQQQEANKRLAGKSIDDLLKEHGEKLLDDPAYLARAIEKAKAKATPVQSQANSTIPSLNRTTAAASDESVDGNLSDAQLFNSALKG